MDSTTFESLKRGHVVRWIKKPNIDRSLGMVVEIVITEKGEKQVFILWEPYEGVKEPRINGPYMSPSHPRGYATKSFEIFIKENCFNCQRPAINDYNKLELPWKCECGEVCFTWFWCPKCEKLRKEFRK